MSFGTSSTQNLTDASLYHLLSATHCGWTNLYSKFRLAILTSKCHLVKTESILIFHEVFATPSFHKIKGVVVSLLLLLAQLINHQDEVFRGFGRLSLLRFH